MIKSLSKTDILISPFSAQKNWEVDNLNPSDLILWMSQSIDPITGITSSITGGISLTYIDYGDNSIQYPITNSYCDIALQQQTQGYVTYQKGVYNKNLIYPTASNVASTPQNLDGTYTNLIYAQNQHLYYNPYNNFTQTFGMESADLAQTNRTITDTMDVFTVPQNKFGDKIVPNSVMIVDDSLDKPYTIVDDGNCNLIFSGSVFTVVEKDSMLDSIQQGLVAKLQSYDITGSINGQISNLLFQTAGDISIVSSSLIFADIVGGIAPYTINWYIGGDYKDSWTLSSNGQPSVTVKYNTVVSLVNPLYYANTYIVCSVVDTDDNQTFSNLIYLTSGSIPYIPPPITGSPIPTGSSFPPLPPTDAILHLANTGKNTTITPSGQTIDSRYVLYNYVPDSKVVSSILGVPSDISPYSSSYIGGESELWYTPDTSIADWISPVNPTKHGYGNSYAGNFTYRIYFDLVSPNNIALSPSGFALSGSWAVDETASISINGMDSSNSLTGSQNFSSKTAFNITGGFVSGRNYIDFKIYNSFYGNTIYDTYENPCGLYVEFDPTNDLFVTHTPPSITGSLSPIIIPLGSPISLSTTVSGDNPISYQWYLNSVPIPNATSNIYTKAFSQNEDVGIYTMSASNAYGVANSSPINVLISQPGLSSLVLGQVTSTTIAMSWSPVDGATAYNIKRSNYTSGPYTTVATITPYTHGVLSGSLRTHYTDSQLSYNTSYYYVVSAVTSLGETNNSNEISATTLCQIGVNWYDREYDNVSNIEWKGNTSSPTIVKKYTYVVNNPNSNGASDFYPISWALLGGVSISLQNFSDYLNYENLYTESEVHGNTFIGWTTIDSHQNVSPSYWLPTGSVQTINLPYNNTAYQLYKMHFYNASGAYTVGGGSPNAFQSDNLALYACN
jgi:hypothetical protein